MEEYKEFWGQFSKNIRFEAGEGSRIRFWHNLWCDDRVLKDVFSNVYSVTRYKEVSVTDSINLKIDTDLLQWNISFIRAA